MILVGNVPNLEQLAKVLRCKAGAIPTTYLGLPLGVSYKSSKVWEGVEERFQKRLLNGSNSISQKVEDRP